MIYCKTSECIRFIDLMCWFYNKSLIKQCRFKSIAFFMLFFLCTFVSLKQIFSQEKAEKVAVQKIQLKEVESIFQKTQLAIQKKDFTLIAEYLDSQSKIELSLKGISFLSKSYRTEEYLSYLKKLFERHPKLEVQVKKINKIKIDNLHKPPQAYLELAITQKKHDPELDFQVNLKEKISLRKINNQLMVTELWVEAECPCPIID